MNFSFTRALLALPCVLTAAELPVLNFTNGDRLQGNLGRVDDTLLQWKSPTLKNETPFFLAQVQDITFPPQIAPPPRKITSPTSVSIQTCASKTKTFPAMSSKGSSSP